MTLGRGGGYRLSTGGSLCPPVEGGCTNITGQVVENPSVHIIDIIRKYECPVNGLVRPPLNWKSIFHPTQGPPLGTPHRNQAAGEVLCYKSNGHFRGSAVNGGNEIPAPSLSSSKP